MRLYKALLNDNYDVISYHMPDDVEKILSKNNTIEKIPIESLLEYIEINGYVTVPLNDEKASYAMYLDIDYTFSTIWDSSTSIYVTEQIISSIRRNLIDAFFEDDKFTGSEEEDRLGIIGQNKIFLDELTYMFHKFKGGIWESSNSEIADIDKYNGLIKGKKLGKAEISYEVDTGQGILACFKNIEVIKLTQ